MIVESSRQAIEAEIDALSAEMLRLQLPRDRRRKRRLEDCLRYCKTRLLQFVQDEADEAVPAAAVAPASSTPIVQAKPQRNTVSKPAPAAPPQGFFVPPILPLGDAAPSAPASAAKPSSTSGVIAAGANDPVPAAAKKVVFVSHASPDQPRVQSEIVDFLQSKGIDTWYSPLDIPPTAEWKVEIVQGLLECEWFLVAMTPNAEKSKWVKREVDWADNNREGRIIPLLLEPSVGWLRFTMSIYQHIDFRERDRARQSLLKVLGHEA